MERHIQAIRDIDRQQEYLFLQLNEVASHNRELYITLHRLVLTLEQEREQHQAKLAKLQQPRKISKMFSW